MATDTRRVPTQAAMTDEQTTTERLLECYNSYTRRPTVNDARVRAMMFKSFRRVLGVWLPADRSAPILDIACGEGALLCFLRELGYTNLAGFDLSRENVGICHGLGLGFVERADALCLAEMPGSRRYATIFALDMLEHLPKQLAASFLVDVRNRLLPGGYAVIQTLNMGSYLGWFHRYCDVTHEFGLSEPSALSLFMAAGFSRDKIELRPAWNATTIAGHLREAYLRLVHWLIWAAEGSNRPRIPTRDLLIRATVR
jgi:2-polyprenyl-3-methyl-5-hydroxy-6-metoxy-1,4-benzoquinol methylase